MPTVTYPTSAPGPTVQELAPIVRARGLRQCDQEYLLDRQQNLELAKKYDASGASAVAELYAMGVPAPWESKLVPKK